jgi:hypothetical protein
MGQSVSTYLVYGHYLGGPDAGWEIKEYDEEEYEVSIPWYDRQEDDLVSSAEKVLLAAKGFTETYEEAAAKDDGQGYFRRQREMKHEIDVEIDVFGHSEYGHYALIVPSITFRGEVYTMDEFDPKDLLLRAADGEANNKLAWALDILQIHPNVEEPSWLLGAYWG